MERRTSARLNLAAAQPPHHQSAGADEAERARRAARAARAAERAREVEEPPDAVRAKVRQLARAVAGARHLVVYTGAGISTAAAIPDYRGPAGVWTRLRRGERVGGVDVSAATPTLTHMALAALWRRGLLRFVVSQNCDGLHLRAGLPRRALAELHGDMYVEHCPGCRAAYLRAFDTTERTARARHRTRRLCHRCGAELRDSIVHFGERGRARWPLNWSGALRHARRADVVLCLGSSLKVLRRYPRLWGSPRRRPRLYIVNLQWTPKDSVAELKISARCDDVLRELTRQLRVPVPRYRSRRDPLHHHHTPLSPRELHTTRRPLLRPSPAPTPSSSDGALGPSSSGEDSDDDRPLRQLADSLRLQDSDSLRAFQVQMRTGEATILMRARHAPSAPETRPRHVTTNGYTNGHVETEDEIRPKKEEDGVKSEVKEEPAGEGPGEGCALVRRLMGERGGEGGAPGGEVMRECAALARAIFAHAVLVCRASLYPGLHTIIPVAAAGSGGCAWCRRWYGARGCLFYRPHDVNAGSRAERVVGGRRYMCACCGEGDEPSAAGRVGGGGGDAAAGGIGGGWYGKGYCKGRRRKR